MMNLSCTTFRIQMLVVLCCLLQLLNICIDCQMLMFGRAADAFLMDSSSRTLMNIKMKPKTTMRMHPPSLLSFLLQQTNDAAMRKNRRVILSSSVQSNNEDDGWIQKSETMRIKELKQDLNDRNIPYQDCFDRESLVQKWIQAQQNPSSQQQQQSSTSTMNDETTTTTTTENNGKNDPVTTKVDDTNDSHNNAGSSVLEEEKMLSELRSMRVKELRTELGNAGLRWAGMIEKEELVQALWKHKQQMANFSISGALKPGTVTDINDDILEQECSSSSSSSSSDKLLVLDVYATWCGPCKMMAPQLEQAAQEWGSTVRVAKIDSDKYPISAGKLKIGGLPTTIVFDGNTGKEVTRQEGALMKDGLLNLVKPYM